MSTRDELEAALISGFAIKNAVWVENDMPCLRLGEVADYLLSQGWRPPMRESSTVEELESLPVWTELLDADYGLIQKVDSPYGTFIRPGSMAYWSAHDIVNCGPFLVQWEPECES